MSTNGAWGSIEGAMGEQRGVVREHRGSKGEHGGTKKREPNLAAPYSVRAAHVIHEKAQPAAELLKGKGSSIASSVGFHDASASAIKIIEQ